MCSQWITPLLSGYPEFKEQEISIIFRQYSVVNRRELQIASINPLDPTPQNAGGQDQTQSFIRVILSKKDACSKELSPYINGGGAINNSDNEGMRFVHAAAKVGAKEILLLLLNTGKCEINVVGKQGYSPLHYAITANSLPCVKVLLDSGNIDLSLLSKDFETPLALAQRLNYTEIQNAIKACEEKMKGICLKGEWLKFQFIDTNGTSMLHWAAEAGMVDSIPSGRNVDITDKLGHTPLHYAAFHRKEPACLKLLEKGANPNFANLIGFTPFHYICGRGYVDTILKFLDSGGDPNTVDHSYGITPLHILSYYSKNFKDADFESLVSLLMKICSFNNPDMIGLRPIKLVEEKFKGALEMFNSSSKMFYSCETGNITQVRQMIEENPNLIHMTDSYGNTILHYACLSGDKDLIFFLVNNRVNINKPNRDHKSAIHYADQDKNEALSALIEAQALLSMRTASESNDVHTMKSIFSKFPKLNPNYQNFENGRTALHIAVESNAPDCLAILVENGAQILPDDDGITPLHLAAKNFNKSIIKQLVGCQGISKTINLKDANGNTALHLWCMNNDQKEGERKTGEDVFDSGINILMSHGSSEKETNNNKDTPESIAKSKNPILLKTIKFHVLGKELLRAVSSGNVATMEELIQQVKNEKLFQVRTFMNYRDKDKKTALHWAGEKQVFTCIDRLINEGADPNAKDSKGRVPNISRSDPTKDSSALIKYCATGQLSLAENILKRQNFPGKFLLSVKNSKGETPLYCACVGGEESNGKLNPGGWSNVVAMLVKYYDTLNERTVNGNTALHGAAKYGNVLCVQILLENGADPDELNGSLKTPLDLVPISEEMQQERNKDFSIHREWLISEIKIIVKLLLQQHRVKKLIDACFCGDLSALDEVLISIKDGHVFQELESRIKSEFSVSRKKEDLNNLELWRQSTNETKRITTMLNEILNSKCNKVTALEVALQTANYDVAHLLIESRADPTVCQYVPSNLKEHKGAGAVYSLILTHKYGERLAVKSFRGEYQEIELLFEEILNEPNFGSKDFLTSVLQYQSPSLGYTALHWAVMGRRVNTIELLLKYGATVDLKDSVVGNTPVHLAAMFGHDESLQLLLQQKDAPINVKNDHGYYPIILSSLFDTDDYQSCLKKLAGKADVGQANIHKQTPLIMAAKCGNLKNVKILIEQKSDVNVIDEFNKTPLLYAISQPNWNQIVPLLIENGADVNIPDKNGDTPITHACRKGNSVMLKQLLRANQVKLDHINDFGTCPLHESILNEKIECVKALIECGADINVKWTTVAGDLTIFENITPLILIILIISFAEQTNKMREEIFRYLLSQGASISYENFTFILPIDMKEFMADMADTFVFQGINWATILYAMKNGETATAQKALQNLDQSFKTNWLNFVDRSKTGYCRTLLHFAVHCGDYSCVERLIRFGANTEITDVDGKTPLDLTDDDTMRDIFKSYTISLSLEKKVNEIIQKGTEEKEDKENFKKFLETNNFPIDTPILNGNTPLHQFAHNGKSKFVKLLIQMNSDINQKNDNGDTPLHLSVRSGKTMVVDVLFKNNAKVDIKNSISETVKDIITEARTEYLHYLKIEHDEFNLPTEEFVHSSSESDKEETNAVLPPTHLDSDKESSDEDIEDDNVLTRKEEATIDEQVVEYSKVNRQKGKFLNSEDIEKYKQMLISEALMTKKIQIRKKIEQKKQEKKEKRKKRREEEKSKRVVENVKQKPQDPQDQKDKLLMKSKKEDYLKNRLARQNEKKSEQERRNYNTMIKCYSDILTTESQNDRMICEELGLLKSLIGKMRSGSDVEFTYKEIVQILQFISTSNYSKNNLKKRMQLLVAIKIK
eukprot:TRINITY_DN13296_c0_g1_i1.p1 TRINITY_DN13296_c0_g1~~TRINITY_DN13296_c0_g1_i1.p1  ORF type:complete len:2024 (+),score=493.57 TRINITY_DN13296_c0_g1_i1:554-6073(+)